MPMPPAIRSVLPVLFLFAANGCYVDCSTHVDQAVADAVVRDANGAALSAVTVYVQEDPDIEPHWSLAVYALPPVGSVSSPLAGHVTGARLVAGTGEVLFELPLTLSSPGAQAFVGGQLHLPTQSAYLHVRDAVLTGQARVIIESTVSGLESISTLLSSTQYNPPRTRHCPYT